MATVITCDKCGVIVKNGGYWDSEQKYKYGEIVHIKASKKKIKLLMQIIAQDGSHLDICDTCASLIIDRKVNGRK